MANCSKCGKQLAHGSGTLKTMQTGLLSGGGPFMRRMNVCSKCAATYDAAGRAAHRQKLLLVLLAILAAAGGAYWWFFVRQA